MERALSPSAGLEALGMIHSALLGRGTVSQPRGGTRGVTSGGTVTHTMADTGSRLPREAGQSLKARLEQAGLVESVPAQSREWDKDEFSCASSTNDSIL